MYSIIKQTLLIAFILIGCNVWSQKGTDYILWSTTKLKWNDFKAKPDGNSQYDARTNSQMEAPNTWTRDSLHLEAYTKFIPSKSWVKKNRSKELLNHEQLHFDITEYHTRLFRKAILNYRFSSYRNVGAEVAKLFYKYFGKAKKMQSKYDRATNHSRNKKQQKKWNEKVAQLLESTEAYTMTKIDLYIGYIKK